MEMISNTLALPGVKIVGKINLSKFQTPKKGKKNGKKRYFKPSFGGFSLKEVWPKS